MRNGSIHELIEAAERAYAVGHNERHSVRREQKVGEFYERLPEDVKAKIRTLNSDDFRNVRPDAIERFLEIY